MNRKKVMIERYYSDELNYGQVAPSPNCANKNLWENCSNRKSPLDTDQWPVWAELLNCYATLIVTLSFIAPFINFDNKSIQNEIRTVQQIWTNWDIKDIILWRPACTSWFSKDQCCGKMAIDDFVNLICWWKENVVIFNFCNSQRD